MQLSSALKNQHISELHFLEANQGTKTFAHLLKVAKIAKLNSKSMTPPLPNPHLNNWTSTPMHMLIIYSVCGFKCKGKKKF